MRIAILTNSFSAVGGAENSTQGIARRLQAEGRQVTVYVRHSEAVPAALSREFDVRTVPDEIFCLDFPGIWLLRAKRRAVCRELKAYDAVLFCMLQSLMALFPYLDHPNWVVTCRGADIQNPRRTPYRRLVRDSAYGIRYKGFRTRLRNELLLRVFMLWARSRGRFASISQDMVDELVALGVPRERTAKILNGVDLERFTRIQRSTGIEGRDPRVRYVLCVGRNDSRKGFYYLVDAAEALRRRGRCDIRFVVKGRGFEKLLAFVRERGLDAYFTIVDLGFRVDFDLRVPAAEDHRLPDALTVGLYRLADVVAIPSIIEALSNVGLEAEASDRPLVVADTFGCREYITRGTAVGFRVGDGADLARALIQVLESARIREQLGDARRRWRATLAVERCVDAYEALIAGARLPAGAVAPGAAP